MLLATKKNIPGASLATEKSCWPPKAYPSSQLATKCSSCRALSGQRSTIKAVQTRTSCRLRVPRVRAAQHDQSGTNADKLLP